MSVPQPKRPSNSENYRGLFTAVFHDLVKQLTEEGLKNPEIADGIQHLQEVSLQSVKWAVLLQRSSRAQAIYMMVLQARPLCLPLGLFHEQHT